MRRDRRDGGRVLVAGTAAVVACALVAELAKACGLADVVMPCGVTVGQAAAFMATGAWLAVTVPMSWREMRDAR